jgi:hypothetical protein
MVTHRFKNPVNMLLRKLTRVLVVSFNAAVVDETVQQDNHNGRNGSRRIFIRTRTALLADNLESFGGKNNSFRGKNNSFGDKNNLFIPKNESFVSQTFPLNIRPPAFECGRQDVFT